MAISKKVNSIQEYILNIQKDIIKDQKKMLEEMAEDIKNILYIYTDNWYKASSPSTYQRTYEFINSLSVIFIDDKTVEIGFDPDKMSVGFNNGWIQHIDRFAPLSEIIDEGWEYRRDGSGALKEAIKYLESESFRREVKSTLGKYGYNIK